MPQPQDTSDILAEVIDLFFKEIDEISDNISKINKDSMIVHSIKQAEQEVKQEFMKMMLAKQKEIMAKFGLQTNDFQEQS